MRSLVLLGVYVAYLALGISAPFVCGLGYIWTDLFTPQNVAYIILNQIPVSLIMALCALGFYALADRRDPPRLTPSLVLLSVWIVWVSLTTTWADFPDAAWYKWNWAVKSIIFATIMPFLFRSRVQIEAAILTILLSISGSLISFGAKTIINGGGYGRQWTLGAAASSNTGLNESSTIALVSAALIPLVLFLKRHSLIVPKKSVHNHRLCGDHALRGDDLPRQLRARRPRVAVRAERAHLDTLAAQARDAPVPRRGRRGAVHHHARKLVRADGHDVHAAGELLGRDKARGLEMDASLRRGPSSWRRLRCLSLERVHLAPAGRDGCGRARPRLSQHVFRDPGRTGLCRVRDLHDYDRAVLLDHDAARAAGESASRTGMARAISPMP